MRDQARKCLLGFGFREWAPLNPSVATALLCMVASSVSPAAMASRSRRSRDLCCRTLNEIPVNDSDFAPSAGASVADDRAERIVVAALAEFSENGYSGSRLESVARRAGISKPTLLRHFASKDEIFREVVRSTLVGCMEPLHERLAHTNGGPVSAVEQIREFANSYWAMMETPGAHAGPAAVDWRAAAFSRAGRLPGDGDARAVSSRTRADHSGRHRAWRAPHSRCARFSPNSAGDCGRACALVRGAGDLRGGDGP